MSWASLLLTAWSSRSPSLLLVVMVSRDVGLRVGLEGVQTSMCSRTGSPMEESNLGQDGDIVLEAQSVPVIIDGDASRSAMILSRTLGPLFIPMISYLASCPCLSDRQQYPNFFRTIPSDINQAKVMARLAIRFNWTWIGAVLSDNDYGRLAIQVTDRQFLASEAWSTATDLLHNVALSKVASGVLGVAIRSAGIPGFEQFLRRLHPSDRPSDFFLREFWEKEFGCSLSMTQSKVTALSKKNISTASHANRSPLAASIPLCSGRETLEGVKKRFTDTSHLRAAYNAYLAVYVAAHGLHSLLSCPDEGSAPTDNSSTCSSPYNITPKELLEHLNKVNFTTPHGETFFFEGADIPAVYDLVNWKSTPDGSLGMFTIGRLVGSDLHLNESAIQWSTGSTQVPISVCSKSCLPGTRRANRKGEPVCCFDCIPCTDGEVNNETGSHQCRRCPIEFWSNTGNTACIPRKVDFLSFNETMGIVLTTAAVSGAVVTAAVFIVFLHYRHTPVVRANNSELSFLLLLSLKLCFLCALVFIGRPSVWSCRLQQAAFGISFVLCVSCLQVKTIVVLAAFRSARPGAGGLMKWFGTGQQRGSVCFYTCIQVIICTIWLSLSPPVPYRDLGFQGSKVNLECAMSSVVGFAVVLGYIGFLACLCLLLAFLARKLPDNFNEAKFITFSMLIFCAVWVAFVPAYISSPGKYSVAVEIFAILASSYGLLLCIFAPKCFIILLKPERNTKKHLMGR
ncbi:extracellular calcium-sensing receptor-like [Gadus macrocephalus]|uniref:extracellular calcium-sensing receptor-like n=1 Tax=Gadus macrocephalus TaxID=80720 RepID=UPI0028CB494C|nr:extracellular calcium-sensing receptor-like [Gadus macrocephalus]